MRLLTLGLCLLLAGCSVGRRGSSLEFSQTPGGAIVTVQTSGGSSLLGELVGTRDDGILLVRKADAQVVFVAGPAITLVTIPGYGAVRSFAGERRRLASVSRYPGGVSDELLANLLSAYGQVELVQVP